MFERTLSVNILKHFCPTDVYLGPEKIRRIMKTMSNICFKIIGYVTSVWSAWYIFYLERKIKQKIGKNKKSWWHNSLKALEHNLIRISCTKLELSTVRKVCRRTYKWWWHCIFSFFFYFHKKTGKPLLTWLYTTDGLLRAVFSTCFQYDCLTMKNTQ